MLTVVPISDFLARQKQCIYNQSIKDKYVSLVKTYTCFNDADPQPPPPHVLAAQAVHKQQQRGTSGRTHHAQHVQHANRRYDNTHHSNSHGHSRRRPMSQQPPQSITRPPFLIAQKDKDPIRIIMGLLNVINTDNYSKIFQKLRLLIDYSNLTQVIHAILEKCCVATIFVTVYIKLIEDIGTLYKLNNVVIEWAKTATSKILYQAQQPTNTQDYDEFCKMQKHKLYVSGLNTTMIKLAKAPLISLDILKSYIHFISQNITMKSQDEHNLDICLNCLIDIKKSYKNIIQSKTLSDIDEAIDRDAIPHRLRFLVTELLS